MISSDDRNFLQATGDLLVTYIPDLAIYFVFFGFFFGLWILAISSLLKRGLGRSWIRRAEFAALILTLLISLSNAILPIYATITIVREAYIDLKPGGVIDSKLFPFFILNDWSETIGLTLNDLAVVWRAWVLYSDNLFVLFPLCLVFGGTCASSLAYLVLTSSISGFERTAVSVTSSGVSLQEDIATELTNASNALSLATNLFATSLIFFKLWTYRKTMSRMGWQRKSLTSSQRVLLLLVESGLIFFVLQVLDFIIIIFSRVAEDITFTTDLALHTVDDIYWASLPLFLPALVLLVEKNRSIPETYIFDLSLGREHADVEEASGNITVESPSNNTTQNDSGPQVQ